jgi:hypothetical protein
MHSRDLFATVFLISASCLGIAVLLTAFEYFSLVGEFGPGGALARPGSSFASEISGKHRFYAIHGTLLVLAFRVCCGISLLFSAWRHIQLASVCALAGLFVSGILLAYRFPYSRLGADDMTTIVTVGLLVAAAFPSPSWRALGLSFIAAQTCLCYITSGVGKLTSPVWRNGTAIRGVLSTTTYGSTRAAQLLRGWRMPVLFVGWAVIVFELLFPLALVAPSSLMFSLFAIGAIFHLGNALVMGLNTFLWTFLAAYPAVWYCHVLIQNI